MPILDLPPTVSGITIAASGTATVVSPLGVGGAVDVESSTLALASQLPSTIGTVTSGEALCTTIANDDITAIRQPGNGITAAGVSDANVHVLGTVQAKRSYGLQILPATDGDTVVGHYRADGVNADVNDCPITAYQEHVIVSLNSTAVSIIRDATLTNNFVAYLYPLNGGDTPS